MSPSLSDLANFVQNAYLIAPSTAFNPENIVIDSFTFLPWVQSGVGAVVKAPAGGIRANVDVALPVQSDGVAELTATASVQVRGPGDVLGLDERQIIRRYPEPETTNAEDTFLAQIEFDRPVLPWLFSPAEPSGNLLTPWIALVVLAEGRYEWRQGTDGRPDQVVAFRSELQPTDDLAMWAHAQLVGPANTGPSVDDRLTSAYGPVNLSRLVCPRRLESDTRYRACVVPTYDAGVKVALGCEAPGTLAPAWRREPDGSDAETTITLPVFAWWRFGIGPDGDFGSLANKLIGVPAPWQVGRRLTEVGKPAGGLPPLGPADPGRLQTIRGPLYSPNDPDPDSADPVEVDAARAEDAEWPTSETEALRTLLNRPADLAAKPADPADPPPRPIVGPEIYARYHATASRVEAPRDDDWFGQLNLLPKHRVAAGLGTRVVQKDQEQLMQSAWAQVGAIDETNRQLRRAQLARFVATGWHDRHFATLSFGDLLAATRRVQSRILGEADLTVAADVADSHLAQAAIGSAFRRVTRPLGGIARFVAGDRPGHTRLVAEGDIARDMQRPYRELDGVNGVSPAAAAAVDPDRVAPGLGLEPDLVADTLVGLGAALAEQPAVYDVFRPDRLAGAMPDPSSLAVFAGKKLLEHIRATSPENPRDEPARAVALANLAFSLQQSVPELSDAAFLIVQELLHDIDVGEPEAQSGVERIFAAAAEPDPSVVQGGFGLIAGDLVDPLWPSTPVRPSPSATPWMLLERIRPAITVTARILDRLGGQLPSWLPIDWFDDLAVSPIMAAPVFTRPMYEALDSYSREWLLPGLSAFAKPDIVTVLNSNAAFLEAFLAGLSHEMGRELLWRGYPTDQRGTYFRRFWDRNRDELAQDLHRFTPTPLDTHVIAQLNDRVVLLVRGELIRRYPDALVMAMYAGDQDAAGVPVFEDPAKSPPGHKAIAPIQFHGHLEPDIVLVGFDLTVTEIAAGAVGAKGWWFVIAEHPTAPRFGLAEQSIGAGVSRDELGWDALETRLGPKPGSGFLDSRTHRTVFDTDPPGPGQAVFGADAASTAHVLLRDPIRAAFEAIALLAPIRALP
ncbi:MAG: hypothetical protein M3P10_08755 [Actinomycetota bacterium]|nr:hypothetical protein [Actinomycetota bacterium]